MNFELTRRNTPEPVPENQRIVTLSDLNGLKEIQPGFFEGAGEALKDIAPNAALTTASSAFAAYDAVLGEGSLFGMNGIKEQLRNSAVEAQELGIQIQDPDKFAEEQYEGRLQSTKRMRERAKEEYTPSEAAVGTAGQMIFGVGSELTKLAMALPFGSAAPAVYGANVGISQAQALMDEGVDEDTARDAGFASALAATIGVKLPSAFGKTRTQSAVIGAGANTGLFMSEQSTIAYILNNADYGEVAKRFDSTDPMGLAINAVTGAGFGVMTFRGQRATSFTNEQRKELRDTFTAKLMETGGVNADESNARTQAELLATSTEVLAKRAGWSFDEAIKRAPNIVRDDGTLNQDAFNKVTFGYEWVYGDKAAREADKKLSVIQMSGEGERTIDRSRLSKSLPEFLKRFETVTEGKKIVEPKVSLVNGETNWKFVILSRDVNEITSQIFNKHKDNPDLREVAIESVERLPDIVHAAYLAESHRDIKAAQGIYGGDPDLVGIHRFYTAVEKGGKLYSVKLTVKDKSQINRKIRNAGDINRAELYAIESLEVAEIKQGQTQVGDNGRATTAEYLPLNSDASAGKRAISDDTQVAIPASANVLQPRLTPFEISVRQLLEGVNRDGDIVFDENKKKVYRSSFFANDPAEGAIGYQNDADDPQWQKIQRGEKLNESSTFAQKAIEFEESLMTIHNITEPGLLKAQGLGGLPAPSIAVSKASSPLQQFGEISLIGTRDLADPTKNPVFSVDAYTARFPKLDWSKSVKKTEGRELIKEIETTQPEVGLSPGDTSVTYYLRNRPNRDEAIDSLRRSGTGMAMFLKSKGIGFKPIYKVQKRQWGVSDETIAAYKQVVKLGKGFLNLDVDSEGRKIFAKAVNDWAQAQLNNAKPISAYAKKIFSEIVEDYAKDPQMLSSKTDVIDIANSVGRHLQESKKAKESGGEIDYYATRDALEKKVSKYRDEYDAFIAEKVNGAFGDPSIIDGNKLTAFNLGNVVRAMTRKPVRGAEVGEGNHSPASIRAMASKQYDSFADLQADRDRVVNRDASYESEKVVDDALDEFITQVAPYYAYESKWGGFDDAANALAKAASNPTASNLRRSLSSFGYKNVPNEVVAQGVDALKAAKKVLTDYLEVKPQRAVSFSEFAGAVVPNTIGAEARAVLEGAGLQIQTYNPKTEGARVRATQRLTKRLAKERADILYQKSQSNQLGSYSPSRNEIKLTPNANLSTFSHEMGHWYLDTLFRIVGDNVSASVLARDVDTLLREFGVKSVDAWNKLGVDGQRKYHEQFASWLEVYLSEGKAPKPSLEGVFERVKAWLVDVYKKLGGTKEAVEGRYESEFGVKLPEMSAEVKSVMDRIFAEETFADKVADKFGGLTHAVVDAARLKYYSSRFYKDQPVSDNSPALLNKSKSAEANARERLDNGEKVEITQPIADIERMTQEQGRIVDDMQAFVKGNEEAQLELRAEQAVAENESPDMTSLAKEFEAPDGTGLQTKELDQVIEYRDDGTQVTGREVIETEYAMADEVDRFADIMGEAAECVFRNNGM